MRGSVVVKKKEGKLKMGAPIVGLQLLPIWGRRLQPKNEEKKKLRVRVFWCSDFSSECLFFVPPPSFLVN